MIGVATVLLAKNPAEMFTVDTGSFLAIVVVAAVAGTVARPADAGTAPQDGAISISRPATTRSRAARVRSASHRSAGSFSRSP